tara:strand:- start:399 stop:1202 length:804 start_codon:yes stop_codon:yes gene_type:complete
MANDSIVSVIIPIYNPKLRVFKKCINSLLNQTYKDIEIIIIDDSANTEKNKSFLKAFNSKKLQHHVPTKKLGLAASINKGIGLSNGNYIARADCDDYYHPNRIKKQLLILKSMKSVELCGTNCVKVDLNDIAVGLRNYPEHNASIQRKMHFTSPFAHPSVMFKKSFFKKYGKYKTDIDIEDYELWLRAKKNGCIFYNIQEHLTYLRVENVSKFSRPRHWKENLKLKVKYFDNNFLFESFAGVFLFSIVSIIPSRISKKLYEVVQKIR